MKQSRVGALRAKKVFKIIIKHLQSANIMHIFAALLKISLSNRISLLATPDQQDSEEVL